VARWLTAGLPSFCHPRKEFAEGKAKIVEFAAAYGREHDEIEAGSILFCHVGADGQKARRDFAAFFAGNPRRPPELMLERSAGELLRNARDDPAVWAAWFDEIRPVASVSAAPIAPATGLLCQDSPPTSSSVTCRWRRSETPDTAALSSAKSGFSHDSAVQKESAMNFLGIPAWNAT